MIPGAWNIVRGPNGFAMPLTDDDFVWTVKAVHHEVARPLSEVEMHAVLWTMLNRWASGRAVGANGKGFGAWIRTFSSTVNPKWVAQCRGDEPTTCTAEDYADGWGCCPIRKAWVAANIARPFSWYVEHSPEVVAYVAKFFRGEIPVGPLVGIVNFASRIVGCHGEIPAADSIPGLSPHSNMFCRTTWSAGWTTDTVRFASRPWSRAVTGLGVALLGGVVVFGVARLRRRRLGVARSRRRRL